jgi:uncharacterized protein
MQYRRFGKTELPMPVISCGAMRFQQSWKTGDPVSEESQRNVEACVRKALDSGITHFETARGYGTSEYQLGLILPQLPRDELIVQTKVAAVENVEAFADAFETSMGFLKLDYVDLFAFHGVNNHECLDNVKRCLDQALRWRDEGRVRYVGFSTHGSCDLILEMIRLGVFDYVNLHWYYIFQDNWPAVEEARRRDMGVYIISPNDKGGLLYRPSKKLIRLTAPYHPMVFNDLFCLARQKVHSLSCGVTKPSDFDLHLQSADLANHAAELAAPVARRLDAEMERVLGKDWAGSWHVGLPEWDQTPNEINIPWILRLRNLALALDMVEFGKMRYNLLGNGGHWFPGRRADTVKDVDLTQCLSKSPHAARIPTLLAETDALLGGEQRKRLQQDS